MIPALRCVRRALPLMNQVTSAELRPVRADGFSRGGQRRQSARRDRQPVEGRGGAEIRRVELISEGTPRTACGRGVRLKSPPPSH